MEAHHLSTGRPPGNRRGAKAEVTGLPPSFGGTVSSGRAMATVWLIITGLLFTFITIGLSVTPDVSLQYWYLFSAPLILASYRLGLRGALFGSGIAILALNFLFRAAGTSINQVLVLADQILRATVNPDEARSLVLSLADLRAHDPQTAFARALTGMLLLCIGSVMLGSSIDSRTRITRVLDRAFNQLRRYFSPQVVEAILTQSTSPEGEVRSARSEVTILFSDLRGFTAFSEQMEPEQVAEALNEYFSAMSEEIFREGGTLDKYIGDAVMAVFGAPVWYPDHAERAFRCALAMQERMTDLNEIWRQQGRRTIGMGVGLSIGYAVVGSMGSPFRREYTAIGSTVNIASRMTDLAPAGGIVTTRKSYWRVQHVVDGVPRDRATVKGFPNPLEIVEVHALGAARPVGPIEGSDRWLAFVTACQTSPDLCARIAAGDADALALQQVAPAGQQVAARVAALIASPLLNGIPAAEIAAVAAYARSQEYPAGAVVLDERKAGERFSMVAEGTVEITVIKDGTPETLAQLSRGDHFGEVSLVFDRDHAATAVAATPVKLLVMDREAFYAVFSRTPLLRGRLEAAARSRLDSPYP